MKMLLDKEVGKINEQSNQKRANKISEIDTRLLLKIFELRGHSELGEVTLSMAPLSLAPAAACCKRDIFWGRADWSWFGGDWKPALDWLNDPGTPPAPGMLAFSMPELALFWRPPAEPPFAAAAALLDHLLVSTTPTDGSKLFLVCRKCIYSFIYFCLFDLDHREKEGQKKETERQQRKS